MSFTVLDLKSIASSGGGMILDAKRYTTFDLKSIASSASGKQATIILKNLDGKTTFDLKSIASSGKGCVVFDFS